MRWWRRERPLAHWDDSALRGSLGLAQSYLRTQRDLVELYDRAMRTGDEALLEALDEPIEGWDAPPDTADKMRALERDCLRELKYRQKRGRQ